MTQDLTAMTDTQLGELYGSTDDELEQKEVVRDDVLEELWRRFKERQEVWSYIGSVQHIKDINRDLVGTSHADITPPWEE